MPHVGARLKRPDDPRLLTGRGAYEGQLTAATLDAAG